MTQLVRRAARLDAAGTSLGAGEPQPDHAHGDGVAPVSVESASATQVAMRTKRRCEALGHGHTTFAPRPSEDIDFVTPLRAANVDHHALLVDVVVLERDDLARAEPSVTAEQDSDVCARIDLPRGFDEPLVLGEIVELHACRMVGWLRKTRFRPSYRDGRPMPGALRLGCGD